MECPDLTFGCFNVPYQLLNLCFNVPYQLLNLCFNVPYQLLNLWVAEWAMIAVFFLFWPIFCLLTVGKGYPCTWSNSDTQAQDRAPLCVRSSRLRSNYVLNTQRSRETNVHARSMIRTRDPCKRAAAHPRLLQRCHWDRFGIINFISLRRWITCVGGSGHASFRGEGKRPFGRHWCRWEDNNKADFKEIGTR